MHKWIVHDLLHICIHLHCTLHIQSPITVITARKWLLCASVLFWQNWRLLALIYPSGNVNPVIYCLPLCRVLDTTSRLTRAYVAWAPSVTKSWRLVHIWSSNACSFTFMHLADAFIQSDLQYIQVIHVFFFISICVPWALNPQVSLFLSRVYDAIVHWCVSRWPSGRSSSVF